MTRQRGATSHKHRRCTRRRHHIWKTDRGAGIYGSWVRCVMCGAEDLAW